MTARRSGGTSPLLWFVLGAVFAVALAFGTLWGYLRWGHPPVAVADHPFPFERQIVHLPMQSRIAREILQPPFPASEDAYVRGAQVYAEDCAFCHGVPGQDSPYGTTMYPTAPQLWKKHQRNNAVGVSNDPVGETYWKVKYGVRLTGMPQFGDSLSDAEMWDVSLLLRAADQPLPNPVMKDLMGHD